MDLAKYRNLFLDEATEHLAEMSRCLLELEKDPASSEEIDGLFRMAHSIKGMAASLGYDAITELSHRFEDRMETHRQAGRVEASALGVLFDALGGLEHMVGVVRDTGEAPGPDPELVARLSTPAPQAPPRPAGPERTAQPGGTTQPQATAAAQSTAEPKATGEPEKKVRRGP